MLSLALAIRMASITCSLARCPSSCAAISAIWRWCSRYRTTPKLAEAARMLSVMTPGASVMPDDQRDVIAFLKDPSSYGEGVDRVETIETHASLVFIAGERVYKLKRAVRYPYMDYSTVARRGEMCRRELAVNERSAPDLYLELRALVREGNSIRFGGSDARNAVDWVVVMRRFDERALLETMRREGRLDLALMRALGETVAHYHASARAMKEHGGRDGIAASRDRNHPNARSATALRTSLPR